MNVCTTLYCLLWQYGLWSFQTGGTKLERFLPKNQHTQRKLLNFENWISGEVSKSAKSSNLLTFKVNFLYQKLSESFSIFFSLKNINLGALFLLLTVFDNTNFWIIIDCDLFFKLLRPPLIQFSKFNNCLWVCWFLG